MFKHLLWLNDRQAQPELASRSIKKGHNNSKLTIRSHIWHFYYSLILILVFSFTTIANNNPVSLSGKIVNQYGVPVSGANVVLKEQTTGKTQNISVDAEGKFAFTNATTGEYQISVVANGFVIVNQQISLNNSAPADLVLTLATNNEVTTDHTAVVEEVEQLRTKLAETNQQLANLTNVVQELQAKLDASNHSNIATQPAANTLSAANFPAASIQPVAKPQPAGNPLSRLFGLPNISAQSDQKPENTPLIDSLLPPKSKGGQFAGAEGLLKTDRIKIGGYGDFRYGTRGADEGFEIRENVLENNPDMTADTNFKRNGFIAPRLVVAIAAALTDKLLFNSEIEFEFAGKEVEVEQAYLEYRFNHALNFRGGILIPAIGRFNLFHDANLQDISARPLASTFVIPSTYKDAGIGFVGDFNIGRRSKLTYEIDVVNGLRSDEGGEFARRSGLFESKDNDRFFDNNPQKSVVGRLMFSPIIGAEIGFSGYRGKHDNMGKYDLSITALDFKFARGDFQVLGEYSRASIQRPPEDESEIAAKAFLQSLPKGDYINTFDFFETNINEPIFEKSARSTDGFYVEARYRFHPKWFTKRTAEDGSIAPVFRFDQVNFDRSYAHFSFPLNLRRYSVGVSIRPTEAASFNFTYNIDRKPDLFLKMPDGRAYPPLFTNLGTNNFVFGLSYAF